MTVYRGFVVWAAGVIAVLGTFLIFVAAGWPGDPDMCLLSAPHQCFCEAFDRNDVALNRAGVRQPWNTWLNLYALLTAGFVAVSVYRDRVARSSFNPIRSMGWIPDLYVFVVLFLGLGSMWFHASLKQWAGNVDGLSMYAFTSFLIWYSVRRLHPSDRLFWLGYLGTLAAFTILHIVWQWDNKSFVLISVTVAGYLGVEILSWIRSKKIMQGTSRTRTLWLSAVGSIIVATIFWALSQSGRPLCDAGSAFQPHGWLWHPLAGVTAVLLYRYWRAETAFDSR